MLKKTSIFIHGGLYNDVSRMAAVGKALCFIGELLKWGLLHLTAESISARRTDHGRGRLLSDAEVDRFLELERYSPIPEGRPCWKLFDASGHSEGNEFFAALQKSQRLEFYLSAGPADDLVTIRMSYYVRGGKKPCWWIDFTTDGNEIYGGHNIFSSDGLRPRDQ